MIRLVLFDIDGTLIAHTRRGIVDGRRRWEQALAQVFGRKMTLSRRVNYNGWVDRQIAWEVCSRYGVNRQEFSRRFPEIAEALHTTGKHMAVTAAAPVYSAIPEAVRLTGMLHRSAGVHIGLLTGNVERAGRWKLSSAGVPDVFRFGVFADSADDRIALARTAVSAAESFFGSEFLPEEIAVIGDTVWDIRCAKAVRAFAIGVLTGSRSVRSELEDEGADLVADTLTDPGVVEFFRRRVPGFDVSEL